MLEGSKPTEQYRAYYNQVLSVHSFNALPHHPRIMAVVEQLVGATVLVHPRHICHAIFPGLETFKTPPHQDHFSVGGTPATWTVWLPLGDCDSALGGVMLAEGPMPMACCRRWRARSGSTREPSGAGPGARWPPATW